ncbi:cyclase family protein [Candidatus Protofrankia californiensis]|uniref:cyclase family protein n=1 Tax=Candidatus Protofrankia californiensis TaxID=1839754 RepID=UPI0010418D4B|nr:cyclase family protein [Candidatus Protofrankia californiensis]
MRIRRIVDLSVPLDESTQVYPGDPVPRVRPAATIETAGFNLLDVHLGSQTGTHVDAPYHVEPNGARVDELDLHLLAGPGVILDVTGLAPRERITWDHLTASASADRIGPGIVTILHTGWSAYYGTPRYFDHPFLDEDAATRMVNLGVRTFLLDAASIDETPAADHPGEGFPVHHVIARHGGIIGENLCNIEAVDFDPFVTALPLRLTGADGAPVRAVAMDLDLG